MPTASKPVINLLTGPSFLCVTDDRIVAGSVVVSYLPGKTATGVIVGFDATKYGTGVASKVVIKLVRDMDGGRLRAPAMVEQVKTIPPGTVSIALTNTPGYTSETVPVEYVEVS